MSSQALYDLMFAVSKVAQYKPELITKKQSISVLESIGVLWDEVYEGQIAEGQESYFASNLGGFAIDGNVKEKLSFILKEIRSKDEPPYIGRFWARNLEVLTGTFEGFKYSKPTGQLINQYLPDLIEVSKHYEKPTF